jgi:hypothetical protein
LDFKVTVLESGMAPMITGSIVAIQFGLQPKLATLLSGLGMPISAISLLIWYFLLVLPVRSSKNKKPERETPAIESSDRFERLC